MIGNIIFLEILWWVAIQNHFLESRLQLDFCTFGAERIKREISEERERRYGGRSSAVGRQSGLSLPLVERRIWLNVEWLGFRSFFVPNATMYKKGYRDRLKSLQILLNRTQPEPGRTEARSSVGANSCLWSRLGANSYLCSQLVD